MMRWIARVALVVVTLACAWLTVYRLALSTDLSALFPDRGDAAALARFMRAFGGRDPALILVQGDDPVEVAAVADAVAESLRGAPSIARVLDRAPTPPPPGDPTLAWAYAGPQARRELAAILTPLGMRARLAESRALLLAPVGSDDLDRWLVRDPLRLAAVPWESRAELAAGVAATPGEAFVADDGRARLVVAEPRGSAFTSEAARAVVEDVERAEDRARRPGVTTELAGGHAIAWATERMLKRDLAISGTLSALLASLAFVATFRRARALLAVLPPLALGTLWTTGIAALLPTGLNAVAIGFAAVVVGVGVDTGVHVYAALLEARRAGLPPARAAQAARLATWKPTLTAALVAGAAFGSLALSGLLAMKELGLLCGAGEVLTSVAILLVTPEIGVWLERGPPPPRRASRWLGAVAWITRTRRRASLALVLSAVPVAAVAIAGWPRPADALVAVRPRSLAPLAIDQRVHDLFGGRHGQLVILTGDRDPDRARARADGVAEALEPVVAAGEIEGFDALETFAPSPATQQARLAERDALDLPSRRDALATALRDTGFSVTEFAPALAAFAQPSHALVGDAGPDGPLAWLFARHVARDGDETLVATYVRPAGDVASTALRSSLLASDAGSVVTGFDAIDRALRDVLGRDLLLVGGFALAIVAIAMRVALRSVRGAAVALATLVCEMAVVGLAMRLLSVRWHVYDALVLPILFGVTIDESMFLLHAAQDTPLDEALAVQGPLVAATALTTAAGFAALIACRFDGLRDLGLVGTLGVLAGLVATLVIVPALLRVMGRTLT